MSCPCYRRAVGECNLAYPCVPSRLGPRMKILPLMGICYFLNRRLKPNFTESTHRNTYYPEHSHPIGQGCLTAKVKISGFLINTIIIGDPSLQTGENSLEQRPIEPKLPCWWISVWYQRSQLLLWTQFLISEINILVWEIKSDMLKFPIPVIPQTAYVTLGKLLNHPLHKCNDFSLSVFLIISFYF